MNIILHILLLVTALLPWGCAATSTSPFVHNNTFNSPDHPNVEIRISDEMPFRDSARNHFTPPDTSGKSSNPVIINVESYIFSDSVSERILKISLEKLKDEASKWEICLPDYSLYEDTIHTGSASINGTRFSTGTFLLPTPDGWLLGRTYATIFGPGKNTRLQIHYTEKINSPPQNQSSIRRFHNRADQSFTVNFAEANQSAKRSDLEVARNRTASFPD